MNKTFLSVLAVVLTLLLSAIATAAPHDLRSCIPGHGWRQLTSIEYKDGEDFVRLGDTKLLLMDMKPPEFPMRFFEKFAKEADLMAFVLTPILRGGAVGFFRISPTDKGNSVVRIVLLKDTCANRTKILFGYQDGKFHPRREVCVPDGVDYPFKCVLIGSPTISHPGPVY